MSDPAILVARIKAPSPARQEEIEDFIVFLAARDSDHGAAGTFSAASLPAFAAVWDNPDDSAYDLM